MSPELLIMVILLMGITAVAVFGNEVERHSVRTAQTMGLLLIAAGITVNWLFHHTLSANLTLALLASLLVAAPLLDRARSISLLVVSTIVGVTLVHFQPTIIAELPKAPAQIGTLLVLSVAALIGLIGSALLPMRNPREKQGVTALLGRIALAAIIAILLKPAALTDILISAIITAGICGAVAYHKGHAQPLRAMGMGLVAGTIIAQAGAPQWQIAIAAVIAAYFVFAGIRTNRALLVDDAHNINGTIFMPTLLALLTYGLTHNLAESIYWLGAILGLGILGSLIWPITQFFFGLHASTRQWREGMDTRLGH